MGVILGGESVEVLGYEVIRTAPSYEIRAYEQHPVIQSQWQGNSRNTFFMLAKYIGAFGEPENEASQKIAMTAPVECIGDGNRFSIMRFYPPNKHKTTDSLPPPLCLVDVRAVPRRCVAVRSFTGSVDLNTGVEDTILKPQLLHLLRALMSDGLTIPGYPTESDEVLLRMLDEGVLKDTVTLEAVRWSVAIYNSPFCLPIFRRNEIWVTLSHANARRPPHIV